MAHVRALPVRRRLPEKSAAGSAASIVGEQTSGRKLALSSGSAEMFPFVPVRSPTTGP